MDINFLQILFQIVNFGVVFGAVTFLLYKPIIKMLDDRRKKVEEGQAAAAESLREREELESMKKKAKTQAEKESAKLLEQTHSDVKELKAKLTKEAKKEVEELREKDMAKWEEQKKSAKSDMEKKVSEMAIAIASKVVGADVDKKTHTSLINTSLKELEKAL